MREALGALVQVALPIDQVWAKLSDFSLAHNYVPGITGVEITTDNTSGLGASRKVFSKRPPMDETVVEWTEGQGFLMRLHFGDKDDWGPFKQVFFRYGVRADGDSSCLQNAMRFELKGGVLVNSLAGPLIQSAFKKSLNDITLAQKLFYETGEPVTPARLKAAKAG